MFRLLFAPVRWLFKILVFLLIAGVILLYVGIFFAGGLLEKEVQKKTGFPTHVGTMDISLLRTRVNLLDMEIRNPTHYPISDFLRIARFSADIRPMTLFRDQRVYDDVLLHLDDLALVENPDGETNIVQFIQAMGGAPSPLVQNQVEEQGNAPRFVVEKLRVRIGKFRTIQSRVTGDEPREVTVNLDKTFTEVRDLRELLPELSRDLGEIGAQVVVYLLAESLYGVERVIGRASVIGDKIEEKGEYLWNLGGEAVGNLKNFIEE